MEQKFDQSVPSYSIEKDVVGREKKRFLKAVENVGEMYDEVIDRLKKEKRKSGADVFKAHKVLLFDAEIRSKVLERIKNGLINAEQAFYKEMTVMENRLKDVESQYLRERATDISDIRKKVLQALSGGLSQKFHCVGQAHCSMGRNTIICTRELTPSLTIDIDTDHVLGFLTEHGGITSHAAILARALGIPAVSGIREASGIIGCGTKIFIDGTSGEVIIHPQEEDLTRYSDVVTVASNRHVIEYSEPVSGFQVMANLNDSYHTRDVVDAGAEGIGLYRTEFEFFKEQVLLTEDQQYERYKRVIEAMNGKPVYFRMLDIGGDKNSDFFNLPEEENPYLGFRGSRLLLKRDDLFVPQSRALARASSAGPVFVMYPMIIETDQFLEIREKFYKSLDGVSYNPDHLKHGVMIEVPSVVYSLDDVFKECDFASIGTNDLFQYIFAVDRNNEMVAYDYHPEKKIFWDIIEMIAYKAEEHDVPLSICGEIAANPEFTARLKDKGIKTVSVSPRLIPSVRERALI